MSDFAALLLDHCLSVPSDIDSAISGTLTTLSAGGGSEWSEYRQDLESKKYTVEPDLDSLPSQTGYGRSSIL